MKYLALKAGQPRQACRPRCTLNQAIKQPYGVCCLTRYVFRGVQWGDVSNISRPPSLAHPNIYVGF